MNWRMLISVSSLLAIGVSAFSCTKGDNPYRTLASKIEPSCDNAFLLKDDEYSTAKSHEDRTKCYLSPFTVLGAKAWAEIPSKWTIKHPASYMLSFVEMAESTAALKRAEQRDDLLASLRLNNQNDDQNVVLVYVHGWRHDADIGNGNVRRFRTILGYTRSALNARCIEVGKYCEAKLTGVYLSWRGRSFAESTKRDAGPAGAPGAFFTTWGRKKQSQRLGGEDRPFSIAGKTLAEIQNELGLRHGDAQADKMMVVGHSYGGNMLATYLKDLTVEHIADHTMGAEMKPLLGDLVVLLNPASEAQNWTAIQRAMRTKAKLTEPHQNNVSSTDGLNAKERKLLYGWKTMFPRSQRPFYVSITATEDWNSVETRHNANKLPNHDSATGNLFPLSSYVAGRFDRERSTAIGHLTPEYRLRNASARKTYFRIDGDPVGTSHELITNSGSGKDTSYARSGSPVDARCGSHDGWLHRAQEPDYGGYPRTFDNWDSGQTGNAPLLANMNGSMVQIRHSLYAVENTAPDAYRAESVAQATSPFWNMRAYFSVEGHSDFISFPTLCTLNLLWLDDATSQTLSYKP